MEEFKMTLFFLIFQELEDLIKAKEKEVKKIEQNGLALIQNKKEGVSGVVVSTLQELSGAWANVDHMVMLLGRAGSTPLFTISRARHVC